jgi:hypothetical protein
MFRKSEKVAVPDQDSMKLPRYPVDSEGRLPPGEKNIQATKYPVMHQTIHWLPRTAPDEILHSATLFRMDD